MQIENVYYRMAETVNRDVLIICDRGTMDASACKENLKMGFYIVIKFL